MNEKNKIELPPQYPPAGPLQRYLTGFFIVCFLVFLFMVLRLKMYREFGNTASIVLLVIPWVFFLVYPLRRVIRALNLRPFLYVHSKHPTRGEAFTFDWELKTGFLKIRQLSITLEGRIIDIKPHSRPLYNINLVKKTTTVYRKDIVTLTGKNIKNSDTCTVRFPEEKELRNYPDIQWNLRVKCGFLFRPRGDIIFPIGVHSIPNLFIEKDE